jgi:hypothetical protein
VNDHIDFILGKIQQRIHPKHSFSVPSGRIEFEASKYIDLVAILRSNNWNIGHLVT